MLHAAVPSGKLDEQVGVPLPVTKVATGQLASWSMHAHPVLVPHSGHTTRGAIRIMSYPQEAHSPGLAGR